MSRGLKLLVLAGMLAAALTVATPAGGARECDGLQVCVPVAGPWVVVSGVGDTQRPTSQWQLTCPRRYIVGGLDAEISIRAIDVNFLGRTGSPVNPGITTRRSVTFVGSNVGRSSAPATFKPYIGCMPTTGGGTRIPTSAGAFRPGEPVMRRVKTVRVRSGTSTVVVRCLRNERLVGSSHAFAFRTRSAPSVSLMSTVSGTRSAAAGRVSVRVRGNAELEGVRALVQVHALCAVTS
jgi:hypothetical protein